MALGIAEGLLTWFWQHRRLLPFRQEPSAYHIWVSEIMLQQTRVEAVKPYFERFMRNCRTSLLWRRCRRNAF